MGNGPKNCLSQIFTPCLQKKITARSCPQKIHPSCSHSLFICIYNNWLKSLQINNAFLDYTSSVFSGEIVFWSFFVFSFLGRKRRVGKKGFDEFGQFNCVQNLSYAVSALYVMLPPTLFTVIPKINILTAFFPPKFKIMKHFCPCPIIKSPKHTKRLKNLSTRRNLLSHTHRHVMTLITPIQTISVFLFVFVMTHKLFFSPSHSHLSPISTQPLPTITRLLYMNYIPTLNHPLSIMQPHSFHQNITGLNVVFLKKSPKKH